MFNPAKADLYNKIKNENLKIDDLSWPTLNDALEAYCYHTQIDWGKEPDKSGFAGERAHGFRQRSDSTYSRFHAWMDFEMLGYKKAFPPPKSPRRAGS